MFPEERQIIEEKIQSIAPINGIPLERISFPNAPISDPEQNLWIKVNFIYGEGDSIEIRPAPKLYRHFNVLILQVFQPENTGTRDALTTAKTLRTAFLNLFLSISTLRIRFRTPKLRELGDDGLGYYQINVECPYKLDVTQ